MSANAFTGHALCQALVLEDVPKRAEANIESFLRKLWDTNGPDFVLDYVKVLKKDTEMSLVDPDYRYHHENGEPSVAWNHTQGRPKGPLGTLYRLFPEPTARIRVIGAVIQSIQYEVATPRQLEKFTKNLRARTRSTAKIRIPDRTLQRLENALERRVREVMEPFGPQHLTNNVLPFGAVAHATAKNKAVVQTASMVDSVRDSDVGHRAVLELYADTIGQFYTAPRICKSAWNDVLALAGVEPDIYRKIRYPGKINPRPLMARDYLSSHPVYGILCDNVAEYSPKGTADFLGRLDFLQKPGGKLRSVANVNRYVNYTMEPYAKALEDVFYQNEAVKVKDQHAGLRRVQLWLKLGDHVTSLDLTAATDTLDFRVFTSALKRDFPGKTGLLERYATYFEDLSSLPLWCEGLDSAVQFSTGQPLGMKGSFQTLTAMNFIAGHLAAKEVGLSDSDFVVVGDDFVCRSEMADAYNRIITSWGGSTNAEKAMESSQYAEFLSHIVSANHVYVTKPKFRPGNKALFTNLEKGKKRNALGIYRLTRDEKNAVDIMSQYSVDEMDFRTNLPHFRSKDLSMDDYSLEVMSAALGLVTELRDRGESSFEISRLSMEYLLLEDPSIVDYHEGPKSPSGLPDGPLVQDSVLTVPTGSSIYDHRKGDFREKVSRSAQHRQSLARARDMEKIHRALVSSDRSSLELGGGVSVDTDAVVLSAMEAVEDRQIQNRLQATQELIDRSLTVLPSKEDYHPTVDKDEAASAQRRRAVQALVDDAVSGPIGGSDTLSIDLSKLSR